MKKRLTQPERVLKYLKSKNRYVPIYEVIEWCNNNYIVDTKRILQRLALDGKVESDYRCKKYKSWRVKRWKNLVKILVKLEPLAVIKE